MLNYNETYAFCIVQASYSRLSVSSKCSVKSVNSPHFLLYGGCSLRYDK